MKLDDLVEIRVGQNASRLQEHMGKLLTQQSRMYTNEDLVDDLKENITEIPANVLIRNRNELNQINDVKVHDVKDRYQLFQGDVVYSFVSSTASVVSYQNNQKVFNQNLAKLSMLTDKVDPYYLCYFLNESTIVEKQMATLMQGSVIRKLTPAILRAIQIQLPSMIKQRVIGKAYFELNRYYYLTTKENALKKIIMLDAIKKIEAEEA